MNIRLDYGRNGLEVNLPDSGVTVVEPKFIPGIVEPVTTLRNSLRNPLGTVPLAEMVKPGDQVAISICDSTRAMPSRIVLPVILRELAHLPDRNIRILVATGTHRPSTGEELRQMLGSGILDRYNVINHVCTDHDSLLFLGNTESGIPVRLNRIWAESDIRITTGFVEPDFFAGFSGGPKLVAPGLAGEDALDQHVPADSESGNGTDTCNRYSAFFHIFHHILRRCNLHHSRAGRRP